MADIASWIESLRQTTDRRFFLGRMVESSGPEVKYETPTAFRVCLLGRTPQCDIRIQEPFCSRKHAMVYFKDKSPVIRDLDSRTGTTLNNVTLVAGRDYPLASGDIINISGHRFAFLYEEEKPADASPATDRPEVSLEGHKCPYCYKFIPEFSQELAKLKEQALKLQEDMDSMNASLVISRRQAATLTEALSLVELHHNTYHAEVLLDIEKEREADDRRAAEEAAAEEARVTIVREAAATQQAVDDSAAAVAATQGAPEEASAPADEEPEPPTYRFTSDEAEAAKDEDLQPNDLSEEHGRKVTFNDQVQAPPEKKGLISSLFGSMLGRSKGSKREAEEKPRKAGNRGKDTPAPQFIEYEEEEVDH